MKQNTDAGRGGRKLKDLKRKKLSVTQQAAVRGGFADGSSHRMLLPAMPLRPTNRGSSP